MIKVKENYLRISTKTMKIKENSLKIKENFYFCLKASKNISENSQNISSTFPEKNHQIFLLFYFKEKKAVEPQVFSASGQKICAIKKNERKYFSVLNINQSSYVLPN